MLTKFETKSNRVKGLTFRPAFAVSCDSLFYAKDRFLRCYEYSTQKDSQVIPIRRPGTPCLNQSPRTLSYSPTENAVLICSDLDGGSYELYIIPRDSVGRSDVVQDAKRGTGGSAVFIARNRFAVLEKSTSQVLVKNLKNEVIKKSSLPIPTDAIFYAGTGNLLCRSEDKVVIFDLQQRLVLGELQTPFVRYVVLSNDMENVALLSKHTIIIASKKLVLQCTLHETIRVKSGAWDGNGVFIYTTLNHIKYCLPNGDSGIIRTLDVPIYITKVSGNTIFCLDRDGKNRAITINATEYIFKLALLRKRCDHVTSMIKNSQQKGFPEGKTPSLLMPPSPVIRGGAVDEDVGGDWGDIVMVDLDGMENRDMMEAEEEENDEEGMPVSDIWSKKSSLAAEQAAAGRFDTAMHLLNRQLGIKNFAPLKSMFIDLFSGSQSYLRAFSSSPVVPLAIERGWSESNSPKVRGPPALLYGLSQQEEKLQSGYKATTSGKLTEALRLFLSILHTIPLVVVESRSEVYDVKELVVVVKEYVLGLKMELKRRQKKDDPVRQQELAAYFTHCNLQRPHLRLALFSAMGVCYKAKNLATACVFAQRLLETNPVESHAKAARQIVQAAERNMTDATELNYDFRNPFVICGSTYVPIYIDQKDVSCPYCTARFVPSQEGNICSVCELAVIGADASGLICSPSQVR